MSEAAGAPADTFDAEFAAAREAERDDAPPEVNDEAEEPAEEAEEGAEPVEAKEAVETEAAKISKRLADTQKAMKQERRQRQDLERQVKELLASQGAPKAEKPPTPAELAAMLREDDDDPIGQIQTLTRLAKQLVGETEAETQAEAQQRQRAQALQTVSTTMADYENDFRELNADYDAAAQHFMKARSEEISDTGVSGDALTMAMQNEFAGIVSRSIAAGKDPAEIIYNMAKRRGFAPTAAPAAAVAKLDTIERGQAQAKTLSGGGTTSGSLTAGQIANLKGAAFDAAFDKLRASERRR